jgi:serine/threonine protein kinase
LFHEAEYSRRSNSVDRTGDWQVVDPLAEPLLREGAYPSLAQFLHDLTDSRLIDSRELKQVLDDHAGLCDDSTPRLADSLRTRGLLNDYQLKCLLAGQTFGLVLGNYRVLQRLGSGGMGVVYKAEHIHMRRPVALKVLLTEDDDNAVFLQRFNSEMQALAVLHHPNIVLAFDAGETEVPGEPGKRLRYLVMEYVQGQNLEQYVEKHGPLPIPLACDLIRQVANGLRHAHEHGLIHRDIKPSNLIVTDDPLVDRSAQSTSVKILDFGLARLCRRRCTEAHSMLGTVDYMAPEQARDARAVDIRADIYGLGGTLYWLLTGQRPFPGDRPVVQALLARQHESPVPPRNLRGDIPLELEAIVCQMMARDPSDRYPTPLAVCAALEEFLDGQRADERPNDPSLTADTLVEPALSLRDATAYQAQDVLIFAMAKMAELRGQETGAHLRRMQQYSRVLAEEAMRLPAFAARIDDSFVRMLERCVLLHDIGKVAIPDHILLKPGKLDAEERSIMESHTVLGANLLEAVARQHGACLPLLDMAIEVVRHHHERHDGKGYPDGLTEDAIPLAAHLTALADCYDAMRSKLVYKPGLSHAATCRLLLTPEQGQFDPALLLAFRQCADAFQQIFEQTTD